MKNCKNIFFKWIEKRRLDDNELQITFLKIVISFQPEESRIRKTKVERKNIKYFFHNCCNLSHMNKIHKCFVKIVQHFLIHIKCTNIMLIKSGERIIFLKMFVTFSSKYANVCATFPDSYEAHNVWVTWKWRNIPVIVLYICNSFENSLYIYISVVVEIEITETFTVLFPV